MFSGKWSLRHELEKADYLIKKEFGREHACPYCGHLNGGFKYKLKRGQGKCYAKCENCEKVFLTAKNR